MAACNLLAGAGKVTTEQRHEVVLVTDVFGIESLVGKLRRVATIEGSATLIGTRRHTRPDASPAPGQGQPSQANWQGRGEHDLLRDSRPVLPHWRSRTAERNEHHSPRGARCTLHPSIRHGIRRRRQTASQCARRHLARCARWTIRCSDSGEARVPLQRTLQDR